MAHPRRSRLARRGGRRSRRRPAQISRHELQLLYAGWSRAAVDDHLLGLAATARARGDRTPPPCPSTSRRRRSPPSTGSHHHGRHDADDHGRHDELSDRYVPPPGAWTRASPGRPRTVAEALDQWGWVPCRGNTSRGHRRFARVVWDLVAGRERRELVSFASSPGRPTRSKFRGLHKLREHNRDVAWKAGGRGRRGRRRHGRGDRCDVWVVPMRPE